MPVLAKQNKKKYTYRDYLGFNDNIRREIINGEIRLMSPAPLTIHQRILGRLSNVFFNYLKDKECEAFIAPFDVRLSIYNERDMDEFNVTQPDISIIFDKNKIDERGCKGAPDLIVEILSPGSATYDLNEKLLLYEKAGVKEYWVANPTDKTVFVFLLKNGEYLKSNVYGGENTIKPSIFEDFEINLNEIFINL